MNSFKALLQGMLLLGVMTLPICQASFALAQSPKSMVVFGKALPPTGFVVFCKTDTGDECKESSGDTITTKIVMNAVLWKSVHKVNDYVNKVIRSTTDQELYGVPELWTYPTTAGDCEDFALLKKRYLVGLGFPREDLLMTVLLDEHGDGHAVLTLTTNSGDYVLDNRRKEVLLWGNTGYNYLTRQSPSSPLKWEALSLKKVFALNLN